MPTTAPTRPQQRGQHQSGYLHGMPNSTLRHIVDRERSHHQHTHEHWAFEAMVASLYLDLDAGQIASQRAYAVLWRLGWLDGDHDMQRATMRLRRNWWSSVIRAVIYRATSGGRQFKRGPAQRIPSEWWQLLDIEDPLRLAWHAWQNGRGKAQQKPEKAKQQVDTKNDSDFARKTSDTASSDTKQKKEPDLSDEEKEDAAAHWSVAMVEERFRTLTERDRDRLWRVARGYPPKIAKKVLQRECKRTAANLQKKGLSLNQLRIDFLVRDFTRRITKIIDDEQRRAEGLGQRPRSDPEESPLMTHIEMSSHALEHGNTGDKMKKAYDMVNTEDGLRWCVASA